MTKAELVDQVAATVHLSKSQTDAVLTQCLQAIMDALQAGAGETALAVSTCATASPGPDGTPARGRRCRFPQSCPTFTAGKAFQEQMQPRRSSGGAA